MAGPEIRVLGPLHMSVDGSDVPLGTPMQRAVLGRLIVARGQAVSNERLIDDLWSGQPPPKASSVLQVHIHNLRRLFEPERARRAPSHFIVSESSGYSLRVAEDAIDAWRFEEQLRTYQELISNPDTRPHAAARNSMLDAMLTQWRGPALEAFADTEWAAAEADRLDDLHLSAVELNAQAKLELGRFGEVVIELRALFEEHPGREELVRLLATAQYRLGQQLEALTTIRRSREFLGGEFGVDPAPALRHLESAILNHSGELTPAEPSPGAEPTPAAENLSGTGYTAELSELLTIADTARGGQLRLAWISGEAGIGKTTLAETALGALAASGWRVATGTCPEIEGAPLAWAWSEILREDAEDAFSMSRSMAQWCRHATASAPLALLLEDVHRADTATLQVLRQVVSWLRDEPLLILVTARRSEAGPGVHNTAAALAQQTAGWLELSGLDLAGTRQTARAAGLHPLDDALLRQLHQRTGGNPLFVRELAKLLAAHGSVEQVPESIRELIDDRIAQLPAGITEVLRHISIWGTGIELGVLGLITGIPEDTLIDLIAAAEAAGLVGTGRSGSIVFEHSLIRDAVYLGVPTLRRGRMHWAALELLETHAGTYPVLARDPEVLARHAMLGASPETARHAIEYVRAAAHGRMNHRMRSETVRLLRGAVELHELAGHAADHAERPDREALLDTRCALVTALAYDNQHREARAERIRALTLAEELGGDELRTKALTCWRAPVIWAIRDWRDPDLRIRQALRATGERSRDALVRLLVTATFEAGLEEYPAGQRLAWEALGMARALGDPELVCAAINALTYLEFDYGVRFGELVSELERVAEAAGLAEYQALAHYLRYREAVARADLREAGRRAAHALECADTGQLQPVLDMVSCFAATMELLRGDIDLAEQLYEQFGGRIRRSGTTNVVEAELFCAMAIGWARGDLSGLVERIGTTYAVLPSAVEQPYALALVHAGALERAREVFEGAEPAHAGPYPVLMSALRASAAIALGNLGAIRELYEYLLPHTGTVIGIETGMAAFGPMDSVLAALADALGDTAAGAAHRDRARNLLDRIRTELPDTGDSKLRAA